MRKDNRRITLLSDGNIRFGNKIYDFETVFTRFVHNYWNILIISDIYDDLNISFNKFKEKFRDLHAKNSYENFYRIIQQSFKYIENKDPQYNKKCEKLKIKYYKDLKMFEPLLKQKKI